MKNGDKSKTCTFIQYYKCISFMLIYISVTNIYIFKLNRPLFYSDYNYLKTCIALHNLLLSPHMHLVFLQSIQGFEKDLKASV